MAYLPGKHEDLMEVHESKMYSMEQRLETFTFCFFSKVGSSLLEQLITAQKIHPADTGLNLMEEFKLCNLYPVF